jgi:hypothetical protein
VYDFWGGKSGLNPRRRVSHRQQTVPLHDVIHPGHVGRPAGVHDRCDLFETGFSDRAGRLRRQDNGVACARVLKMVDGADHLRCDGKVIKVTKFSR